MCGFEGHGYVLYNTTLLFSRVTEECSVAGYSNVQCSTLPTADVLQHHKKSIGIHNNTNNTALLLREFSKARGSLTLGLSCLVESLVMYTYAIHTGQCKLVSKCFIVCWH